MTLEKWIQQVVNEFSGGLKFTEMISLLVIDASKGLIDGITVNDCNPEMLEKAIENTPGISILKYTWREMNREKMFIHTK